MFDTDKTVGWISVIVITVSLWVSLGLEAGLVAGSLAAIVEMAAEA